MILTNLVAGDDFAQSVFAEGWFFSANKCGVYGWSADGIERGPVSSGEG